MRRILSIKGVLAGGLLLAALAGAWAGHKPILSWYCVRGLAYADDRDRDKWIKRVAWLDDAALPALVGCLARDDARACANAEAALAYLARRWGPGDPRTAALAAHLGQQFASLSQPGQSAVLEWHLARLHPAGGRSFAGSTMGVRS